MTDNNQTIVGRASEPGFLFRPEGDVWTFVFGGHDAEDWLGTYRISSRDLFGLLTGLHTVGPKP